MKAPTRYGLAGIGALSLLSLVHWLRDTGPWVGSTGAYLLGVAPNFAASIAIIFVLMSVWADQKRQASFPAARRAFVACASISAVGLLGWEFIQKTSNRFVFDPHDAGATLVGVMTACLLFYTLSPRPGSLS